MSTSNVVTAQTVSYFLIFSMQFDRDKGLDFGRLTLNSVSNSKGRTHEVWVATTSTSSKQGPEDFHQKGGLIPPQYRVPSLEAWSVELNPIPMPSVKGVEGNFYKINPHIVTTDKGGVRGDFGIHLDANSPGSLGCIVMDKNRFNDFEKEMKRLRGLGFSSIPLFVQYS